MKRIHILLLVFVALLAYGQTQPCSINFVMCSFLQSTSLAQARQRLGVAGTNDGVFVLTTNGLATNLTLVGITKASIVSNGTLRASLNLTNFLFGIDNTYNNYSQMYNTTNALIGYNNSVQAGGNVYAFGERNAFADTLQAMLLGFGNSAAFADDVIAVGIRNSITEPGSFAVGLSNFVTAPSAAVIGTRLTNSTSDSVEIGPSDAAKARIESTGSVVVKGFKMTNSAGNGKILTSDASGNGSWQTNVGTIGITIDGGGSAITTGTKGYIPIPYNCTISEVTMLADTSGSAVVDVWKDTYASYPPTDADSITASAVPTISASNKSQDSTLTGWTTSVSEGDVIAFNVDSASTITRLTITLRVTKQ